jgi:hypothetical protein
MTLAAKTSTLPLSDMMDPEKKAGEAISNTSQYKPYKAMIQQDTGHCVQSNKQTVEQGSSQISTLDFPERMPSGVSHSC